MKKIVRILAIVLLLAVMFSVWNWFSGKRAISAYILKVQPGISIDAAKKDASDMGLNYRSRSQRNESGLFVDMAIPDGVMGRYVVEIHHDGSTVVKVIKRFND